VNAAEQQITLQLMAEPRIATTPSTIAQTANSELVTMAPVGYKHIASLASDGAKQFILEAQVSTA